MSFVYFYSIFLIGLHAIVYTGKRPCMKFDCLTILTMRKLTDSKMLLVTRSDRVTDESLASMQKSSVDVKFSLIMMHPFLARPAVHLLKKSLKSASVKCPSTHWHQITSYVFSAGIKSCKPILNMVPIRLSFVPKYSLAFRTKFSSCSTKSTQSK